MNSSEREKHTNHLNRSFERKSLKQQKGKWKMRMLSSRPTEKSSDRSEYSYPSARMNHCSVFYKGKIFIWGGKISEVEPKSNPLFLYIYEIDSKKWKRVWTKITCKDLDALSGQCHTIISNRWYLFGGVNKADKYFSELWRFNLDTIDWIKCDQKGDRPSPSEGGQIIAVQKNWLLHFEGFNSQNIMDSKLSFLYSIETKTWHRCEGNYKFSLKFRFGTALCVHNGRIFMFGGAYQCGDRLQYLNDMYQLILQFPTRSSKAKVDIKVISKSCPLAPRGDHYLFSLNRDYLCLLGGHNEDQIFTDLWIYNLKTQLWTANPSHFSAFKRIGSSIAITDGQFFLFGGLIKHENGKIQLMNDLWSGKIGLGNLIYAEDENEITESCDNNTCYLCFQKRKKFVFGSRPFSSQSIKYLKQTIDYPFAAFGLLIDNSLMLGATEIIIQFDKDLHGKYFIMIEDNGKSNWEEEEMLSSMASFCSQNQLMLMGCDKKIKKSIQRSNQAKQYGVNLKLGCLRLGKRFLAISYFGQLLRVHLYYEESGNDETEDRQYFMRYYAYDEKLKKVVDPNMTKHKQFIDHEYWKQVKQVLTSKGNKNVLYIFDTIIDDEDENFNCKVELNDIYFGNTDDIEKLKKHGYCIQDSIDISLKAYLSSLYLKNDYFSISMGFGTNAININLQYALQQIDRLCKTGKAIQLDGVIQFDFKFAEFYFLREIPHNKTSHRFFSNGMLLYYKNRLICRHRPALGQMVSFLLNQKMSLDCLTLFGFAQLPQNVPHNASKTAFNFTIMLEKMFSRIKFVQENFKDRSPNFLPTAILQHPKARIQDLDFQEPTVIKRKSLLENNDQKGGKKRYFERSYEEPLKRSKKESEKGEFTPPNYKMKEIEQEIRKARHHEPIYHSQSNPPILIQHQDDSSIQEIKHL